MVGANEPGDKTCPVSRRRKDKAGACIDDECRRSNDVIHTIELQADAADVGNITDGMFELVSRVGNLQYDQRQQDRERSNPLNSEAIGYCD